MFFEVNYMSVFCVGDVTSFCKPSGKNKALLNSAVKSDALFQSLLIFLILHWQTIVKIIL